MKSPHRESLRRLGARTLDEIVAMNPVDAGRVRRLVDAQYRRMSDGLERARYGRQLDLLVFDEPGGSVERKRSRALYRRKAELDADAALERARDAFKSAGWRWPTRAEVRETMRCRAVARAKNGSSRTAGAVHGLSLAADSAADRFCGLSAAVNAAEREGLGS